MRGYSSIIGPPEITITGNSSFATIEHGGANLVRMNNSGQYDIVAIQPGYPGQKLTFVSIGSANVTFKHQETTGGVQANQRLINYVTSILTPLAPGLGTATYTYDAVSARWRLTDYEQGAGLFYLPAWTGSVSNPAISNGTLAGRYYLRGTTSLIVIQMTGGSGTTFGSGFWKFTIPGTVSGGLPMQGSGFALDISSGINYPLACSFIGSTIFAVVTSTNGNVDSAVPMTWNGTDHDELRLNVEVQLS